ncbi:hypothetical protein ALCH109712_12480 [Alkalicoccus chagannorensis]
MDPTEPSKSRTGPANNLFVKEDKGWKGLISLLQIKQNQSDFSSERRAASLLVPAQPT